MTDQVRGVVRTWVPPDGWGVLDAPETPGGCWCHFSALRTGPDEPSAGDGVRFTYEVADQDGFAFRAVEVHVDGAAPHEPRGHDSDRDGPTAAYDSELRTDWD